MAFLCRFRFCGSGTGISGGGGFGDIPIVVVFFVFGFVFSATVVVGLFAVFSFDALEAFLAVYCDLLAYSRILRERQKDTGQKKRVIPYVALVVIPSSSSKVL